MNEHFGRMVGEYLIQQEVKEERATLAQRVIAYLGALCMVVLLLVAATWHTSANADRVALSYTFPNGNKITLFKEPCQLGEWFKGWKRALYWWNGALVEACWRAQITPTGTSIYTVDAQGEIGDLPPQVFRKDEGV